MTSNKQVRLVGCIHTRYYENHL
ncbi:hypothetical protein ECFRIK1999_3920, partial [Escherichia coli FRIK1999]